MGPDCVKTRCFKKLQKLFPLGSRLLFKCALNVKQLGYIDSVIASTPHFQKSLLVFTQPGSEAASHLRPVKVRVQYIQDIQELTLKVVFGSLLELHHPLILENAKRQLFPDPDIRRMSGGEDASFSGFQFFGPSRTAKAATQPFSHAFQ
jgi:hypothetical protein